MVITGVSSMIGVNSITNIINFNPASITGLKLWLDAAQITGKTDGDSISTWNDMSGNSADATAVGGSPTYKTSILKGNPIIRFVSSLGQKMRAYPTVNTPYTAFVVARMNSGGNGRILGAVYPTYSNYLLGWWNGYEHVMYGEGFVTPGTIGVTTNWHQYSAKGTGSVTSFYENGTLINSNSNGVQGFNNSVALSGYDATGNAELSDCDIAEVIIYNSALSDTDRASVDAYLIAKYF